MDSAENTEKTMAVFAAVVIVVVVAVVIVGGGGGGGDSGRQVVRVCNKPMINKYTWTSVRCNSDFVQYFTGCILLGRSKGVLVG